MVENGVIQGIVDLLDFISYITQFSLGQLKYENVERVMDMSGKDPYVPVYLRSQLELVLRIMSRGVHRIVVIGNQGNLYGMISQSDIARLLKNELESTSGDSALKFAQTKTLKDLKLHKKNIFTVSKDATINEAFKLISRFGVSALAVVNESNQLIGNFSASDLKQVRGIENWEDLEKSVFDFLDTYSPKSLNPETSNPNSAFINVLNQLTSGPTAPKRIWITNERDEPVSVVSLTDIVNIIITGGNAEIQPIEYYTPSEVKLHNSPDDLWVSFNCQVYDLTDLASKYKNSPLAEPLYQAAGTDISHWFENGDLKKWIDPITNTETYYTPMGRFIHVPPSRMSVAGEEETKEEEIVLIPWWKDPKYHIGQLASKTRMIKIVNTLTHQEHEMEVSSSETLHQIVQRYKEFNDHAESYTWKRLGIVLDMTKTLVQNGIEEEDEDLVLTDGYIPVIHIYFNDDLKYSVD